MQCRHCSQSATSEGHDMPLDMFCLVVEKFSERLRNRNEPVWMASGEPTLHPNLFDMIDLLLDEKLDVSISTNGKIKDSALKLGEMAKKGLLEVSLSLDKYHERINPEVVRYFKEGMSEKRFKEIGDGSTRVWAQWGNWKNVNDRRRIGVVITPVRDGRAKSLPEAVPRGKMPDCKPQISISPIGRVAACGGKFGCPSVTCCPPYGEVIHERHYNWGNVYDPIEKFADVFEGLWRRAE